MKHRGFSLLETTLATVVVSVLLVSSVSSLSTALVVLHTGHEGTTADKIAAELIAEISSCAYQDPENAADSLGPEETTGRDSWDDCDDYHGWGTGELTHRGGDPWGAANGWWAKVSVQYVNPVDGTPSNASECKEIVVLLTSPRVKRYSYTSYRAESGLEPDAALAADLRTNRATIEARGNNGNLSRLSAVLNTEAVEQ